MQWVPAYTCHGTAVTSAVQSLKLHCMTCVTLIDLNQDLYQIEQTLLFHQKHDSGQQIGHYVHLQKWHCVICSCLSDTGNNTSVLIRLKQK